MDMDQNQVELAILMTMLANFSLIGTLGNALVIFVFTRVPEKSTAQVFMIFLAVIDLLTCTVIIPLTMFMEYNRLHIEETALCKVYHFLITSKIPLSAFIMVVIAVDRYFCICHPLTKAITMARARLIMVGFVVLASTLGLITSFYHGVMITVGGVDYKKIFKLIGHNMTLIMMNVPDRDQQLVEMKRKVAEEVARRNLTVDWNVNTSLPRYDEILNSGKCGETFHYLPEDNFQVYMTAYNAIFPACLVAVIALYAMIYRFMCLRRSKKLKQRLKMCSYVNQNGATSNGTNGAGARDDENGFVTELSALSQSPILNKSKMPKEKSRQCVNEDEGATKSQKGSLPKEEGRQFLCPPTPKQLRHSLSFSCTTLNVPCKTEVEKSAEEPSSISHANSCSHIAQGDLDRNLSGSEYLGLGSPPSTSASCSFLAQSNETERRKSGLYNPYQQNNHTHHSNHHLRHPQQNKIRQYKKQESIKRYKNKQRALLKKDRQQNADRSKKFDPGHLRQANRRANARTALMLFTVNIVFAIAFGPAWLTKLGVIPEYRLLFYLYFIYNAANPFIYAFMNHTFKSYTRNIFTCKRKALAVVSQ